MGKRLAVYVGKLAEPYGILFLHNPQYYGMRKKPKYRGGETFVYTAYAFHSNGAPDAIKRIAVLSGQFCSLHVHQPGLHQVYGMCAYASYYSRRHSTDPVAFCL